MLVIKTAIVQQPGTFDASFLLLSTNSGSPVQANNQAAPGSEGLFPARTAVHVPQSCGSWVVARPAPDASPIP